MGTPEPGGANVISFNNGTGVRVTGGAVQIRFNKIFANGHPRSTINALGIDLAAAGVTPNDPGDTDTGPNNLQNFPELTSVAAVAGGTRIEGTLSTLNSTPEKTFLVDFYSNVAGTLRFNGNPYPACDASGYGEGETYLGTTSVTIDASGTRSFSYTIFTSLAAGAVVTATATDPDGNTSEFSACKGPGTINPTGTIIVAKQTLPAGERADLCLHDQLRPGLLARRWPVEHERAAFSRLLLGQRDRRLGLGCERELRRR